MMTTKFLQGAMAFACSMTFLSNSVVSASALEETSLPMDDLYYLVDYATNETLDSYDTWKRANDAYHTSKDDYENLGIVQNQKCLSVEYGIAVLNRSDACDVNLSYTNSIDETNGYINPCYGVDAAYLSTYSDGETAEIVISSVRAEISLNDLTILPLQNVTFRRTAYTVTEGNLYHEIKTETFDDNYASILNLGKSPDYLSEGNTYYSCDGHYFYAEDRYDALLDDYRNETHENAVNAEDPLYDYYQFVSHRTLTNVTEAQLEDYVVNTMGIKGPIQSYQDDDQDSANDNLTRSQYDGEVPAFYQFQYQYGANALMMFALSKNESDDGTSLLCYQRNNLFGHAAYDSDVEANASRYQNVDNSIYAHARYYVSGSYASPMKSMFHGSFFGNKSNGMNVEYASDPYWGEKAASYYRSLDETLGSLDLNSATLGIKTSTESVPVYAQASKSSAVLYRTGTMPDFSFVILSSFQNEEGDWYKIQSEATLDDAGKVALEYTYDYAQDIAYISADSVQLVIPGTTQEEPTYVHVTLDSSNGQFAGGDGVVTYAMPAGLNASSTIPTKENALFVGWDSSTEEINEDRTLTALYAEVDSIEVSTLPKTTYELNDRIDLTNGIVTIHFTDGTTQEKGLTTSMICGYDLSTEGDQEVLVTCGGKETSYAIKVNPDAEAQRAEIKNSIQVMIEQYAGKTDLTDWDRNAIIALKQQIDSSIQPYLTQSDLRTFDSIVRTAYNGKIRYVLEKNPYNLGVSGLSVSYPLGDSLSKFFLVEDTYRIRVSNSISSTAMEEMTRQADYMKNTVRESFNLVIRKNYEEPSPEGPLLITIDKPAESNETDVFRVIYYDQSGDVIECYTRQSTNCISFMTRGEGSYMVLSRRTSNVYDAPDPVESVTAESSSMDFEKVIAYTSIALAILVLAFFLIRRKLAKQKREQLETEHIQREEEKAKEPAAPADMTEAIHNLETTMIDLNVDAIRKAEEEQDHD